MEIIWVITTQEVLEAISVCRKPTDATKCPTIQPPTRRDALVSNFTRVSMLLLRVVKVATTLLDCVLSNHGFLFKSEIEAQMLVFHGIGIPS